MPIHTQKLPPFARYAAYTDELGLIVFGSCRDEALNNLTEEICRSREATGEAPMPSNRVLPTAVL